MAKNKHLEDSEWLFTIITALVKKEGGELRVPDEVLLDVSKKDLVGLYYDKKENCTIFKLLNPSDLFGNISLATSDDMDN
mgnify:CR=1 FL=1|tara:strand:+ start:912 stop:1151 length:240 start_codon:yes stop_codon:yes gene_type:complete